MKRHKRKAEKRNARWRERYAGRPRRGPYRAAFEILVVGARDLSFRVFFDSLPDLEGLCRMMGLPATLLGPPEPPKPTMYDLYFGLTETRDNGDGSFTHKFLPPAPEGRP